MTKSISKLVIVNMISSMLVQGVAFLSTPIFTRLLGSEQYGKFSIFNAWLGMISCVMGFGVMSTLATGRYTYKKHYYAFRNCIMLFGIINSFAILFLCIPFLRLLSNIFAVPINIVMLVLLGSMAQGLITFEQSVFIYEKKALLNLFFSSVLAIGSVILSIMLIVSREFDELYFGRVYGNVIIYFSCAFIVAIILFFQYPVSLKKEYCKYGITVGGPMVFHAISHNILAQSDRLMMRQMGTTNSEIGVYSLFYTMSSVLAVILNSLNTSWCPFYYDSLDSKDWETINSRSKNYIELFSILTAGFLLVSREVTYIMSGEEYWNGVSILPILVLAVFFTFMYQFPTNFEFFYKKTKTIAIGTVLSGLINITLNYLLIPEFGMYGASVATVISYLFLFFMHYMVVVRMKEQKYHMRLVAFLPGILLLCIGVAMFYGFKKLWIIRWCFAVFLGSYEVYRIVRRSSIF